MRIVRTVAELRAAVGAARARPASVGFVPTMGALHDGHLALVGRARADCDLVVLSIFVNPAQFDREGDLAAYPREERRDAALAAQAGVDVLFAPGVEEVYPAGFATTVSVAGLTETLEGEHRGRAHFDGVTTVVTKLLNMVAPDVAYFGQKDAQQALVVKRLVRDLDMPVRIEVCPTVREDDGLALSSRNARLSPEQRTRAVALSRALAAAEQAIVAGERGCDEILDAARDELEREALEPEYLAIVDAQTLAPLDSLEAAAGSGASEVLIVVAAQVGPARLIDNALVRVAPDGAQAQQENVNRPVATAAGNANGRK